MSVSADPAYAAVLLMPRYVGRPQTSSRPHPNEGLPKRGLRSFEVPDPVCRHVQYLRVPGVEVTDPPNGPVLLAVAQRCRMNSGARPPGCPEADVL
jgi:hypothetical protein